jgi:hypothetical protein
MQSAQKIPKKALFALEKFLKILIKNYLFKSSFLSFLIFSVCCFVAAKTDPRGVHAHFGWISRFPGTLGGFNFIFFLRLSFPLRELGVVVSFLCVELCML